MTDDAPRVTSSPAPANAAATLGKKIIYGRATGQDAAEGSMGMGPPAPPFSSAIPHLRNAARAGREGGAGAATPRARRESGMNDRTSDGGAGKHSGFSDSDRGWEAEGVESGAGW